MHLTYSTGLVDRNYEVNEEGYHALRRLTGRYKVRTLNTLKSPANGDDYLEVGVYR